MSNDNVRVFCLFEGRHPLPPNEGPLYYDFDFVEMKAWCRKVVTALNAFENGEQVAVIVTGLTPALTKFISVAYKHAAWIDTNPLEIKFTGTLILLHWNKRKQEYFEQIIFQKT